MLETTPLTRTDSDVGFSSLRVCVHCAPTAHCMTCSSMGGAESAVRLSEYQNSPMRSLTKATDPFDSPGTSGE